MLPDYHLIFRAEFSEIDHGLLLYIPWNHDVIKTSTE